MISSTQNPKIKWLRQLQSQAHQRRSERTIIIEGVRLAEEALSGNWRASLVIYTEDLNPRGRSILEAFQAQGAAVELVSESVMRHASDTQTPQGILAALDWQDLPLHPSPDFVFIPDQIRDPGNLGTMLRTAAAAGVYAALLPPETVDPFAPKTLRAGMGAQFHLPIRVQTWDEIKDSVRRLRIFLAAAGEGKPHTQTDFRLPLALIIGGEAEGASPEAHRLAEACVHVPMPGGSESLNAAVAAGILLFEVVRQRQELIR
jgi:TrmH family RNA methyltransferase